MAGASPWRLKRAFAGSLVRPGDPEVIDPLLSAEDRAVLEQLVAFPGPVSVSQLRAVLDGADPSQPLQRLVRRFLVEPTGDELLLVPEIVRETLADAGPPSVEAHRRCQRWSAELLRREEDETERFELQVACAYHAAAAGDDAAALSLLEQIAEPQRGLLPLGALRERRLLDAISLLSARTPLPLLVRLLHLQLLARGGRAAQALAELEAVAESEPLARLDVGAVAFLLGDLEHARRLLSLAVADQSLSPVAELYALGLLFDCSRQAGEFASAQGTIARLEALVAPLGPLGQGVHRALEAILAFDTQRYGEALVAARAAHAGFAEGPFFPSGVPTLAALVGAAQAALGLAPAQPRDEVPALEDALFFRGVTRLLLSEEALMRGDLPRALKHASEVCDAAGQAGYAGLRAWAAHLFTDAARASGQLERALGLSAQVLSEPGLEQQTQSAARLRTARAAALLETGRLDELGQLLATTTVDASALPRTHARLERIRRGARRLSGAPMAPAEALTPDRWDIAAAEAELGAGEELLWLGQLERAVELLSGLATRLDRSAWPWASCAAWVQLAEAHGRRASWDAQAPALARARALADRHGLPRQQLRCELLAAHAARSLAAPQQALAHLDAAQAIAQAGPFLLEAGVVEAARRVLSGEAPRCSQAVGVLARRLELDVGASVPVRTASARWRSTPAQVAELARRDWGFLLDVGTKAARVQGQQLGFDDRQGLWVLLLALAADVGQPVSYEALAQRMWGTSFHRLRHRSRLVVTVSRLRKAIGREAIVAHGDGYSLAPPTPWLIVEAAPGV